MEYSGIWNILEYGIFWNMEYFRIWNILEYGILWNMEHFSIWNMAYFVTNNNSEPTELIFYILEYGIFWNIDYFRIWNMKYFGICKILANRIWHIFKNCRNMNISNSENNVF